MKGNGWTDSAGETFLALKNRGGEILQGCGTGDQLAASAAALRSVNQSAKYPHLHQHPQWAGLADLGQ
jgi:hypothetical protein